VDIAAMDLIGSTCSNRVNLATCFRFKIDNPVAIIVELDGNEATVDASIRRCTEITSAYTPEHAYTIWGVEEQAILWQARKDLFTLMMTEYPGMLIEDICVPVSQLSNMVLHLNDAAAQYDMNWAAIGNIGEGNLHVGALFKQRSAEQTERCKQFFSSLLKETLAA